LVITKIVMYRGLASDRLVGRVVDFPEISGNISKTLEVISFIIFIQMR